MYTVIRIGSISSQVLIHYRVLFLWRVSGIYIYIHTYTYIWICISKYVYSDQDRLYKQPSAHYPSCFFSVVRLRAWTGCRYLYIHFFIYICIYLYTYGK